MNILSLPTMEFGINRLKAAKMPTKEIKLQKREKI